VERGTVIFLEQQLSGIVPDRAELADVRERILHRYPTDKAGARPFVRASARARKAFFSRLWREWSAEPQHGPGWLTRMLVGGLAWAASGGPRAGLRSWRSGEFVVVPAGEKRERGTARGLAGDLVSRAIDQARHARLRPAADAAPRTESAG
jgi:hypothetical protein